MAMSKKRKAATEGIVTLVSVVAALVLLNALAAGSRVRLDLTEQQIYSLSSGSKSIVRGLAERLLVKSYFGNVPAEQVDDMNYVDSLLQEYAAASDGKVVYERIEVDTSAENVETQRRLAEEGVQPMVVTITKDDARQDAVVYFHVKFQYLDQHELWKPPRNFSIEGLEYDFSSIIRRIGYGKKRVGVTQGFGEPPSFKALELEGRDVGGGVKIGLGDLYEVVPVNWAQEPRALDGVDVLIVNGPSERVSEAAQYHLDQFLMQGKPVIFLVRGMKWEPSGGAEMQFQPQADMPFLGTPVDHGLGELLATYGFEVGKDVILDPQNAAPGAIPLGQEWVRTGIFFPAVRVLEGGEHEILQGFDDMALPFASTVKLVGPLEGKKAGKLEGGGELFPLFVTYPTSYAKSEVMLVTRQTKVPPPTVRPDGKPEKGPYLAGAAYQGKLRSHWADKPRPAGVDAPAPPDPDGDVEVPPAIPETRKESPDTARLVVIGGHAFAEDRTFGVLQVSMNPVFLNGYIALHSLVDWAAQDVNLVKVRAKQVMRPIEPLEKRTRLLVKYGNIAGVPIALVIFGVVYWRVRERRRRHIKL